MSNTKENIMKVSLRLFSEKGFDAVSVSMIAGELGITKGALYRHYKSKRDIFDSILARMERGDASMAQSHGLQSENGMTLDVSPESFAGFTMDMFRYWTEDEFASLFRRMLVIEQYASLRMQSLYQQYLVSGPLEYTEDMLREMGFDDCKERAVRIYSAMYLYMSLMDGSSDRESVIGSFEKILDQELKEGVLWKKRQ